MDAKLVNPFLDAFSSIMPQIGFQEIKRNKMGVKTEAVQSRGVTILVGFTKNIRGNIAYNMSADTAMFIASTMMMGMPVTAMDEMAQSAVSEMANMLTANAATNLTALGYEADISTPSLSVGESFIVKISNEPYLAIEMDLGGHIVELNISVQ